MMGFKIRIASESDISGRWWIGKKSREEILKCLMNIEILKSWKKISYQENSEFPKGMVIFSDNRLIFILRRVCVSFQKLQKNKVGNQFSIQTLFYKKLLQILKSLFGATWNYKFFPVQKCIRQSYFKFQIKLIRVESLKMC